VKNMKFTEFLNLLYEKQEIVFGYKDRKFSFEISSKDLDCRNPLTINLYEIFDDREGQCILEIDYIEDTYKDDIDKLIEMPLFEGKSLMAIERQIVVISNS